MPTLGAGKVGLYGNALTAATVATVTITDDLQSLEIGADGTAAVYFTTDGSAPTVGGDNTYLLPATGTYVFRTQRVAPSNGVTVKLISSGTPAYWVAKP